MTLKIEGLGKLLKGDVQPISIDFGTKRSSKSPFLQRYHDLDVPIHPNSVTSIRLGNASGKRITVSAYAAEKLIDNNLNRTYSLLHDLSMIGLLEDVRIHKHERNTQHRFQSWHYTDRVAEKIDIDRNTVTYLFEIMRAISVYTLRDNPQLNGLFDQMVGRLYEDILTPPSRADHFFEELNQDAITNPVEWFKKVYKNPKRATFFGKLVPYEMNFFEKIFSYLMTQNRIDPFSKLVLDYRSKKISFGQLQDTLKAEVGIPVAEGAIEKYFHTLYLAENT
ncbi:MAG: hypothetical protein Q7R95_00660 [bacterium]|nr:hypothetical protein [bacterium]